jgi:hypothetical protein
VPDLGFNNIIKTEKDREREVIKADDFETNN